MNTPTEIPEDEETLCRLVCNSLPAERGRAEAELLRGEE